MTRSEAPATTNPYRLSGGSRRQRNAIGAGGAAAARAADGRREAAALSPRSSPPIVASAASLIAPVIIGRTVDTYIRSGDFTGRARCRPAAPAGVYLAGLVATYVQTLQMGTVGRHVLFNLRNALFTKLQQLPLDFFNQNKAGDLISRINNDTDKLNHVLRAGAGAAGGNLFLMAGAAIFLLALNLRLGLAALVPAVGVFVITAATVAVGQARERREPAVPRRRSAARSRRA